MACLYFGAECLILLVTIGFFLYKFLTRNFDYWKKRNVPYLKPIPFFGNYYEVTTFRTTIGHFLGKIYNKCKTPYLGIFCFNQPILIIKDVELIKAVLVKDFNYFCDRTLLSDEKSDFLFSKFLFTVKNPEWKIVRSKMTPVFTSGKMKGMLELMKDVAEEMINYTNRSVNSSSIEAKELCAKYSTDVIATSAFGIKSRCFENEKAEFRIIGRKMFDFSWEGAFRQISYFTNPTFIKTLKMRFFKRGVNEFFRDVFWEAIKLREKTNSKKNDLIDIIIEMKKQPDHNIDFTGDRVVAQAAMFSVAGFETTSSTMAFTLYELALSPSIQSKARLEIKEVLAKHGSFTYEALQELKYLHMIFCETLRKYPVLPFLDRLCIEDYKLPDNNIVIEKGTPVYIPMFGIHHNPLIYPEPEKFDPDRFSEENKKNLSTFSFLPFGEGPRNCIGERFGLMSGKLGLAYIISNFELEKSSDTRVPLQFEPKSLILAARGGLPIKFKKLDNV